MKKKYATTEIVVQSLLIGGHILPVYTTTEPLKALFFDVAYAEYDHTIEKSEEIANICWDIFIAYDSYDERYGLNVTGLADILSELDDEEYNEFLKLDINEKLNYIMEVL